ncbi:MAG: cyclic nucleotide-binding domain-containing protein [Deltaproteobacteria bacterium]|nr:cyclic nucleotide-binding domain-containing protein [Deltaproteobacteria bacterium]
MSAETTVGAAELTALLDALPGFRGLPPGALAELALLGEPRRLRAGQLLFREGEPADQALLLLSGKLAASVGLGAASRALGEVHPGELVGELALLGRGQRRSADVTAVVGGVGLLVGPDTLRRGASSPAVAALERQLLGTLTRRIRKTNQALQGIWREEDQAAGRPALAGSSSSAAPSPVSSAAPSAAETPAPTGIKARLARLFGGA